MKAVRDSVWRVGCTALLTYIAREGWGRDIWFMALGASLVLLAEDVVDWWRAR